MFQSIGSRHPESARRGVGARRVVTCSQNLVLKTVINSRWFSSDGLAVVNFSDNTEGTNILVRNFKRPLLGTGLVSFLYASGHFDQTVSYLQSNLVGYKRAKLRNGSKKEHRQMPVI